MFIANKKRFYTYAQIIKGDFICTVGIDYKKMIKSAQINKRCFMCIDYKNYDKKMIFYAYC